MQSQPTPQTTNPLDRMAQAIVDIGEGCTDAQLAARGFTPDEIEAFGTRAVIAAGQLATRRIDTPDGS